MNSEFNIIQSALLLYDEMYWECCKKIPDRKKMGIRFNPLNGKKKFAKATVISDEVFDYLVKDKQLLEVDHKLNFKSGVNYFVVYSIRPEIQIECRKMALNDWQIPRKNQKDLFVKTKTPALKIDDELRRIRIGA